VSIFNPKRIPEVTAVDAESGAGHYVFLDVREPHEWEAGHAPGAIWIPLADLERARTEVPFNREVVCICRSGGRSTRAVEALISWGFRASNLAGGMKAWEAAGLAVVRDDGSAGTVA
jgi:rhodanese-related sulfurtransferase